MGAFPQYSNVYPELQRLLDTRANNTNKPWVEGGVSGLSTWIRVISGVDSGLVMQSIHGPTSFEKIYGNSDKPGILGYQLDMRTPVEIDGVGRGLRPSPIIRNLNVDEKAEGGSRLCKFQIHCFTKEQCEKISQYFLEPGFHVLVEFGWNVNDSWRQIVGGGGPISVCDIVKYDEWKTIKEKRKNSKFQYDAMLGIVTGGGVSFGDGETYIVDVDITGVGNVAEYMQTHRGGNKTDSAKNGSGESFKPQTIAADAEEGKVGVALFKQMFNGLPAAKRTSTLKAWVSSRANQKNDYTYEGNYVNFDEVVKEYLLKWLTKGQDIRSKGGEPLEIPTEQPLFDEERFIRFELACDILNEFPFPLTPSDTPCGETKNLTINIKNTFIGGFPHMFSTDKTKLFIPNTTAPNFNLKGVLVKSKDSGDVEYIKFNELTSTTNLANLHPQVTSMPPGDSIASKNGSAHDPATGQSRPVPFAFPCEYDLNSSVINWSCDDSFLAPECKRKFWGWLKDLYINFDFFVECLSKPNLVVRDVLYDMLNGMSSACNSLWKFQIQEKPAPNKPNGNYELQVVDLNFTGDVDPYDERMAVFQARGTKSPFIKCDFSMEAQGAMMSSVVQKKMSNNQIDGSNEGPRPMFGKVFSTDKNDKVGSYLLKIKPINNESVEEEDKEPTGKVAGTDTDAKEDAKAKAFEIFSNRAGVFSKIQDREGKIDIADTIIDIKSSNDGVIEDLLMVGTWNDTSALKQIELIDKGLVKGAPQSQTKAVAQKQNPPLGIAKFSFDVHGVSGFKVGDKFQVSGLPDKFGSPNFYQVMKVDQSIDDTGWLTNVKGELRMIGEEE